MRDFMLRECSDNKSDLAKRLNMSQPSASNILNRKSAPSIATARVLAKVLGTTLDKLVGPEAERPGENLKPPSRPPLALVIDPPIDTFLLKLNRHLELLIEINENPGRWRLSTVARALEAKFQSDSDGIPMAGWAKVLDELQSGTADRIFGTADDVTARIKAQHGPRPKIRP